MTFEKPKRRPSTPRKGWIYWIDPGEIVLKCNNGHLHKYAIAGPETVECKEANCSKFINTTRVERGRHPYIFWSISNSETFPLAYAVPLTSKATFTGLPTTYPISPTKGTGLACRSYALVNQLITLDIECFKNTDGYWLERLGVVSKEELSEIEERIFYIYDLSKSPSDDWFTQNTSPELIKRLFFALPNINQQNQLLEDLLDDL